MWRICIDGNADGGTAPHSDDVKIEIVGHSNLTVYSGTGSGWVAAPTLKSYVTWKDSITTSPYNSKPHWILEVQADKGNLGAWGANPPPEGLYISMYDATTNTTIAWPPTSPDVPNNWGSIATYTTSLPESINIGVVALLSSVAVVVGFYSLRKKPKITKIPHNAV